MSVRLWLVCIVLLALFISEIEARGGGRGGGRGGSRSSSRSRSRYNKPKTFANYGHVKLSGRIVKGSSFYNKNTWQSAAERGRIYGGYRYLVIYRRDSRTSTDDEEMPTICTNTNGTIPETSKNQGNFICPMDTSSSNETYCCGLEKQEYCCDKLTAQKYYADNNLNDDSPSIWVIIGIFSLVIVIALIVLGLIKLIFWGFTSKGRKSTKSAIKGLKRCFVKKESPERQTGSSRMATPFPRAQANSQYYPESANNYKIAVETYERSPPPARFDNYSPVAHNVIHTEV